MNTTQQHETPGVEAESAQNLDNGQWQGSTLIVTSDVRRVGAGVKTYRLQRCELDDTLASYFCAVNGETFGLISLDGQSCIATVELGLSYASKGYRYVTFALQSRTASALRRWRDKWTKRTAPDAIVDFFDASVRR